MSFSHIRWISSGSSDADSVISHAARELSDYVLKITGLRWDVRGVRLGRPAASTVYLGLCDQLPSPDGGGQTPAPWDDGYVIWTVDDRLYIAGRNARSVLFGVYAFLEMQGARFVRPGRHGEVLPKIDAVTVPGAPVMEEARYRHRGVCIEGAPSIQHALEMVDWCTKNRMNTVFLQFQSSRYFFNNWYERAYNPDYADHKVSEEEALALDDRVIAALMQRGLVFHRVGHGWTGAAFEMPRSGWVKADKPVKPEYVRWLAQIGGERKLFEDIPINTELCYSYRPAFDVFVARIVEYCEAHPELDVVHVWLSDARNNKCECDECRPLSISDWYAKIINALSEALHQRAPKMRFVFLAYIELLWPPEKVAIDERYGNAILMFAPINRCYGHSLVNRRCDDGKPWPHPLLNRLAVSPENAFYVRTLADWRQAFKGDSFAFDYHLMWHNWRQLTDTQVARVFHEDLGRLKSLGLNGLVSCQSFRNFYPSGLAMASLARSLWNPDGTWENLREEYLGAAYGEHAAFAGEYLAFIETATDTGDAHRRVVPFSNADAAKLSAIADHLESALAESTVRREKEAGAARRRSLELLEHHAQLLQFLVKAHQARLAGNKDEAQAELRNAGEFLRSTEPHFSTEIDTMLALRLCVEAHTAS